MKNMQDVIKIAQNANDLFDKGKYLEALSEYFTVLAYDLNNSISHCNIGITYEMLNEFELAVAFYKKAIRLDETNIRATNNLARIYIDVVQDYNIASQYLDFAIKTDPNDAEAYNIYGNLCLKKNDYKMAEDYFKKSIFLDEKFFKNYYDLAVAYIGLKDNQKAHEALERCLALRSDFIPALELQNTLI